MGRILDVRTRDFWKAGKPLSTLLLEGRSWRCDCPNSTTDLKPVNHLHLTSHRRQEGYEMMTRRFLLKAFRVVNLVSECPFVLVPPIISLHTMEYVMPSCIAAVFISPQASISVFTSRAST